MIPVAERRSIGSVCMLVVDRPAVMVVRSAAMVCQIHLMNYRLAGDYYVSIERNDVSVEMRFAIDE